jgi:hypothetical protein
LRAWRIAGEARVVGPGEEVVVPAGVPHRFWNEGSDEAHAIQEFRPALQTRAFFEWFFGLARNGRLRADGVPHLFDLAVGVRRFGDVIRLMRPPWAVQRAVFGLLRPVARAAGYR